MTGWFRRNLIQSKKALSRKVGVWCSQGRGIRPGCTGLPAGFTLVEIMIAIAIMAVLLAITFPVARGITAGQQRSRCATNLQIIGQNLLSLREDYQAFPRDRWEVDVDSTLPTASDYQAGIGDMPTPGFPGIVGIYSLYYLTEYTGEFYANFDKTTGNAQFIQNDNEVIGSVGTGEHIGDPAWLTSNEVLPGDKIIDSDGHSYSVASIEDDNHLLLTEPYGYTGNTGAFTVHKVLANQVWFAGGDYLRRLNTLHCPANPLEQLTDAALGDPPLLRNASLSISDPKNLYHSYNNYDLFYRRDWFDNPPYPTTLPDKRNLVESAYPPADTLVTFCPYHRVSQDFITGHPDRGDQDVVLFADGAVMVLPSYPHNAIAYDPDTSSDLNPAEWFSRKRAEAEPVE